MLPPECAFVLPGGKLCAQFALRGRLFCRFHEKSVRIEKVDLENQQIRREIASLDLQFLIGYLQDRLDDAVRHRISPDVQRIIYEAAQERLTELLIETQIADVANPNSPYYDPEVDAQELRDDYIRERSLAFLAASPAERNRDPRMEDFFGPRMAGQPTPPGIDLNAMLAAIDASKLTPSANYVRTSAQECQSAPYGSLNPGRSAR